MGGRVREGGREGSRDFVPVIPTLLKRTIVPLVRSTCCGLMTRIAMFYPDI